MPYQAINLPPLTAQTTTTTGVTIGIGNLDDAERITLFMVSTANAGSSGTVGLRLSVSQFDPAIPIPDGQGSSMLSTGWFLISTGVFPIATSSGHAHIIESVAFRGLRLSGLTSATAGEIIARVVKHVNV